MIPLFKPYISSKVKNHLLDTLYSGYITQGSKVEEFEYNLRKYLDVKEILTTNSCTSAIQLAVKLAGVEYGDKVITTPQSCSATTTSILVMGGKVIWADIQRNTGNIDPNSIEDKLKKNPDVKAIVLVHWAGYPCDLDEVNYIARKYGVKVIEDAAHAFGARYKGLSIGNHSDFIAYSFQAIKQLTTVDGGGLVCNNLKDYERGKLLRWFGIDRDKPSRDARCYEDIKEAGYKYHMNDVNATIGIHNLKDIDDVLSRHISNGQYYDWQLQNIPGVTLLDRKSDRTSAYWIYTILVKDRAKFMENMHNAGIMTSQVHNRIDKHTMCSEFDNSNLPETDYFSEHQVNIPCGWWLTNQEREYIINTVRKVQGL